MEYWNNPLHTVRVRDYKYDPVISSFHNGRHCLFWNPASKFDNIVTNQRLDDLIKWANEWLETDGVDGFEKEPRNHYDIANLTKLNMWVNDIRQQGIVKPWLLQDQGNGTFVAGTGDSRLRCLEVMPEIATVPAFVSTTTDRAHLYADLEPVTDFAHFAKLCKAEPEVEFIFRLTEPTAPYGMYWYEYTTNRTRAVTPGQDQAVCMFLNYARSVPNFRVSRDWFTKPIVWTNYTL
jgi:hypothetical protein